MAKPERFRVAKSSRPGRFEDLSKPKSSRRNLSCVEFLAQRNLPGLEEFPKRNLAWPSLPGLENFSWISFSQISRPGKFRLNFI